MYLEKLNVVNFKNYSDAEFAFSDNINCFVGDNGVGKTNLLDAIHYLSVCKSYFNPIDSQNIKHNEPFFVVQGTYHKNKNIDTIYCGVKHGENKKFKLNQKEYSRLADHIGLYPMVMVSPADIVIITGGSDDRRKFVNIAISQFDKQYLNDIIIYKKALNHRNALLKIYAKKGRFDYESIELVNEKLIESGENIFNRRKEFIKEFIPIFQHYYEFITDKKEKVSLIYQSQLEEGNFGELLKNSLDKDKILQYTSVGTHKDELELELEGYPLKKIGSQGQKKSFLVALKLAKFDFIKRITNIKPTLLLDDIFDKLDEHRVKKIIELVGSDHFGQIFITDTSEERMSQIMSKITDNFKIFKIEKEG